MCAAPPDLAASPPDLVVPDLAIPDFAIVKPVDMVTPPNCLASLAGVGTGNFTVSFQVVSTAGAATLLSQSTCPAGNSAAYWYVGNEANGTVYATINGITSSGGYAGLNATTPINDGKPHTIALQRRNGSLLLEIDGSVEAATTSGASLDSTLPPVQIGKNTACGTTLPAGLSITSVCLTTP